MGERVHRSVMNIKVGMFFYILSLFLAFFSRKVFLDCLGAEFIGLTGMLMNIMSFLSVAELGIGTSIVYFLYKPLQEDNHEKINEVMSMLAYLYRCIGFTIGGLGIIVSLFFPWWFGNLTTGLPLVYFAFYSFLATTVSAYVFNFKQLLVSANQKQYLVQAYFQTTNIVQSLTQILLAYYYRNLWLWVVVGLVFTIIGIIVFNIRIRQLYPWLDIKIKDFILNRSDEILVGAFVSVTRVAFYGNYTIILNKIIYLVNILADGMSAGIGNLLAEGDERNIMKVFWEMTATRFYIMGAVIFPLILFIQPTISCWLGSGFQLSLTIVYLLIFNLFLRLQYATVYMFVGASGLYGDVWTSWAELIINIAVTLALAPFFGIAGILLGKIVSVFYFNVFWKPYYLFSEGFHKSVWEFWKPMTTYYGIFGVFAVFSLFIKHVFIDYYVNSWATLLGYGTLIFPTLMAFYFLVMFVCTRGMKYFVARKPAIYHILCKMTFQ